MTGSVALPADVAEASDTRVKRARTLLDAWCRLHNRTLAEVPFMAERSATKIAVGALVYGIRRKVGLDIMPTAELLGMHPGTMAQLQGHMIDLVERSKNASANEQLRKLFVEAGWEKPRAEQRPQRFGRTEASKAAALQQRQMFESRLQEQADSYMRAVLAHFPSVPRYEVVGGSKEAVAVRARYIIFAIFYYIVVESYDSKMIADYFKVNVTTLWDGLRRVHLTLLSPHESEFKTEILGVCAALKIEPERLMKKRRKK